MKLYRAQRGQTLVEVVVVVGVVVLLVTGLVIGTTSSLRVGEGGKVRSQAVTYAKEGMELARKERDTSWSAFAARSGTYCLDALGVWTSSSGTCPVNIASFFTRTVVFSYIDPRMTVTVTVSWQDSGGTKQTSLKTFFTQWK